MIGFPHVVLALLQLQHVYVDHNLTNLDFDFNTLGHSGPGYTQFESTRIGIMPPSNEGIFHMLVLRRIPAAQLRTDGLLFLVSVPLLSEAPLKNY